MKRTLVLCAVLVTGTLSLSLAAFQAAPAPAAKVLEAQKVRDNLYVLTGTNSGGNTAVFITATGVVVVDTKNPGWGRPILDKIKELTPKPVTMIINTHTHFDHVSGNVEFPATVDIVTQENTAANMKLMRGGAPQVPNIFDKNGGNGLSKRSFKDRMTIGGGNDRIDLYYFGRGHTNGDAWVVFPALHVVHVGDMFAFKQPPIVDISNGGSAIDYPETLLNAYSTITGVDTIINGHLPVPATWSALKEYEEYTRDLVEYAQKQMSAGKSVDEATADYEIPDRFKGYTSTSPRVKTVIQVIYDELKK
jgi:cyclase